MPKNISQEILHQHWVHSHEEDTDTEIVFRPAGFNFPRSRGRIGFELKHDGGLVETGIAPADGPQQTQGTWKLEGDDSLVFYTSAEPKPRRVMKIASVDKSRLVVKKG